MWNIGEVGDIRDKAVVRDPEALLWYFALGDKLFKSHLPSFSNLFLGCKKKRHLNRTSNTTFIYKSKNTNYRIHDNVIPGLRV